jgi:hypothetical protein
MTLSCPFIRLLLGRDKPLDDGSFRFSLGEWCRLVRLASKPTNFKDGGFHMFNQMRHAAAALRAPAAAAENFAWRHHAILIELHQAADGLLDVARGNDIALTDDHELTLTHS